MYRTCSCSPSSKFLPLSAFDSQLIVLWGVGEGTRMVRVVACSVKVLLETRPQMVPHHRLVNDDWMW
jgi:hypothetical protein